MQNSFGFLILGFLVFFYFIPTVVAFYRSHHNTTAIVILNIFGGWTFIGWLGALVWASMKSK